MANRLTHRGRRTYNNASNQKKIVRTPGNKLVYIPKKKRGPVPKCISCASRLNGIEACRPSKLARIKKMRRTVKRTYGGNLCGSCLENRILDTFLASEEKAISQNPATALEEN